MYHTLDKHKVSLRSWCDVKVFFDSFSNNRNTRKICRPTFNSSHWCLSIYFLLKKLMSSFWRLVWVENMTVQILLGKLRRKKKSKLWQVFDHSTWWSFRNTQTVGITSLGLEHTSILGNTLTDIAWQKAGIIKENSDVFTVPQADECMTTIRERCDERNVSKIFLLGRRIPSNSFQLTELNGR